MNNSLSSNTYRHIIITSLKNILQQFTTPIILTIPIKNNPDVTELWCSRAQVAEYRHEWQKHRRVTQLRLILTTSYSEALTLLLHSAEKCSFSFVDCKIHDPKKDTSALFTLFNRDNISIILKYKNMNIPLVLSITIHSRSSRSDIRHYWVVTLSYSNILLSLPAK